MVRRFLAIALAVCLTALASRPVPALARGGGGCFLPDTPITRADGATTPISQLRPGDDLLAFDSAGRLVATRVQSLVEAHVDGYLLLTTDKATVKVTVDHPFYVGGGQFRTPENLKPGDCVYAVPSGATNDREGGRASLWSAAAVTPLWLLADKPKRCRCHRTPYELGPGITQGDLSPQRIVSIVPVAGAATVYNLQTDNPHTFFAAGFAVHNKGGGGGGGGGHGGGGSHGFGGSGFHGGGSGGSGNCCCFDRIEIAAIVIVLFIVGVSVLRKRAKGSEDLDQVFARAQIEPKAAKTAKLLGFIAQQDQTMKVQSLQEVAKATFLKLQECWQARDDYSPMQPLLMPDLYQTHLAQLAGLRHDHERDVLAGLRVLAVDIVHIRYTEKPAQRQFTALITASARDHYVNDQTGEEIRGDAVAAEFQEFWTFHLVDGKWLLSEIEQTRESAMLKEENFFEQFTDKGLHDVYGKQAAAAGPAGDWLGKDVEAKATKVERMLNFLARSDTLWDRQTMIDRVRQVFLRVMLAQEAGQTKDIPDGDLFPEIAESLKAELARRQAASVTVEYRNLCVRKVELVLVRNMDDHGQDEFTARVSAHAQKVVRKAGAVLSQDADVTVFEDFWVFGRLDNQWKLKELLPPGVGKGQVSSENVDAQASPEMVQWYYRHTRATL